MLVIAALVTISHASDYRSLQSPIACGGTSFVQFISGRGHIADGIYRELKGVLWNDSPVYADNFGSVIYRHTDTYYRVAGGSVNSPSESCVLRSQQSTAAGATVLSLNGRSWLDCTGKPVDTFSVSCIPSDVTDGSSCDPAPPTACPADVCVIVNPIGHGHTNGFELAAILCLAKRVVRSTDPSVSITAVVAGSTGATVVSRATASLKLFASGGPLGAFVLNASVPAASVGFSRYRNGPPTATAAASSVGLQAAFAVCVGAPSPSAGAPTVPQPRPPLTPTAPRPAPPLRTPVIHLSEGVVPLPESVIASVTATAALAVVAVSPAAPPAAAAVADATAVYAAALVTVHSVSFAEALARRQPAPPTHPPASGGGSSPPDVLQPAVALPTPLPADAAAAAALTAICPVAPPPPVATACTRRPTPPFSPPACGATPAGGTCVPAACAAGYRGSPTGLLTCIDGVWVGTISGCEAAAVDTDGAPCVSPYVQPGYTSSCADGAADGDTCTAKCAAGYSGAASGSVVCVRGRYLGAHGGCARCVLPLSVCVPHLGVREGYLVATPPTTECVIPAAGQVTITCAQGFAYVGGSATAYCTGAAWVGGFGAANATPIICSRAVKVCDRHTDCSATEVCETSAARMSICGGGGQCVPRPTAANCAAAAAARGAPVCGCNGVLYTSSCAAHAAGVLVDTTDVACLPTATPTATRHAPVNPASSDGMPLPLPLHAVHPVAPLRPPAPPPIAPPRPPPSSASPDAQYVGGTAAGDNISLPVCGSVFLVEALGGDDVISIGGGALRGTCAVVVDGGDGRDALVVDLGSDDGDVAVSLSDTGYLTVTINAAADERVVGTIRVTMVSIESLTIHAGAGLISTDIATGPLGPDGTFAVTRPRRDGPHGPPSATPAPAGTATCTYSEWGPYLPNDDECACGITQMRQRILSAPPPPGVRCVTYQTVPCPCPP